MNKYICHYEDPFSKNESVAEGGSIFDFKDGFWIDGEGKLTLKINNCKYWIPPSRIYYIEKHVVEDEEGKAVGSE